MSEFLRIPLRCVGPPILARSASKGFWLSPSLALRASVDDFRLGGLLSLSPLLLVSLSATNGSAEHARSKSTMTLATFCYLSAWIILGVAHFGVFYLGMKSRKGVETPLIGLWSFSTSLPVIFWLSCFYVLVCTYPERQESIFDRGAFQSWGLWGAIWIVLLLTSTMAAIGNGIYGLAKVFSPSRKWPLLFSLTCIATNLLLLGTLLPLIPIPT